MIFIRQGYYKNAILKFVINYPEEYPDVAPVLNFISPVYHALVNPLTGELDISVNVCRTFISLELNRGYRDNILLFLS